MAAPDIQTLFSIESAVETALRGWLTARLDVLPAFIQRETRDLPAQFVAIQFTTGAETGHVRRQSNGTFRPDAFACTLTLQVQTVRIPDKPDVHNNLVGRVREIVNAARYDSDFLAYHVLNPLDAQAGTESVMTGDDTDISALVWTGIVGIRPSAWP